MYVFFSSPILFTFCTLFQQLLFQSNNSWNDCMCFIVPLVLFAFCAFFSAMMAALTAKQPVLSPRMYFSKLLLLLYSKLPTILPACYLTIVFKFMAPFMLLAITH